MFGTRFATIYGMTEGTVDAYTENKIKEFEAAKARYQERAAKLSDEIAAAIEKTTGHRIEPVETENSSGTKEFHFTFTENVRLRIEQYLDNRWHRHDWTDEPMIRVEIGASVRRFIKNKKNGLFNIGKAMQDIKNALEAFAENEKRQAEYERQKTENERLQEKELAGIELPGSVRVIRNSTDGAYFVQIGCQQSIYHVTAGKLSELATMIREFEAKMNAFIEANRK